MASCDYPGMRDETPIRVLRGSGVAPVPGTGWWLVAAACGFGAFVVWIADLAAGVLLVIAGDAVPGRVPVEALTAAGLALGGAGIARRRWPGARRVAAEKPMLARADRLVPDAVRKFLVVAALVLSCLAEGAHLLYASNTTVLRPAAPDGCLVIAGENSFLLSGGGWIYQADGEWGLATRVASFSTIDGAQPFEAGSYRLTWRGEIGTLDGVEEIFLDPDRAALPGVPKGPRPRTELVLHCA